ncbi:MAG: zinc ABC transporter substrate-binding protein [Phycisphaerales bacterium]|nr:zinc ABC transporter substrate-binding protein [Phycisphaerales bacterium]
MKQNILGVTLLAGLALGSGGCRRAPMSPTDTYTVAVTNSYLQSALGEFDKSLEVFQMAGPGQCPGHFDLQPGQIETIRRCRLLLRFDFQSGLDEKLGGSSKAAPLIVGIKVDSGLCVPASYLEVCRQASEALVSAGILEPDVSRDRMATIEQRLTATTAEIDRALSEHGLIGRPVLCSRHQQAFCDHLGLKVAGAFTSSDVTSPVEIDQAIQVALGEQVKIIIANEPEGRRLADRLATRLDAEVVVFANFPTLAGQETPFDDMLRENVRRLLLAGGQR